MAKSKLVRVIALVLFMSAGSTAKAGEFDLNDFFEGLSGSVTIQFGNGGNGGNGHYHGHDNDNGNHGNNNGGDYDCEFSEANMREAYLECQGRDMYVYGLSLCGGDLVKIDGAVRDDNENHNVSNGVVTCSYSAPNQGNNDGPGGNLPPRYRAGDAPDIVAPFPSGVNVVDVGDLNGGDVNLGNGGDNQFGGPPVLPDVQTQSVDDGFNIQSFQ